MTDLTEDELTFLLIAAEGESMMPIGRWEAPAKSMVARGYLQRNASPQDPTGNFNLTITTAGRQAALQNEDNNLRTMIQVNNEIQDAQARARQLAESIADQLVELSQISSKVTAETGKKALERWSRVILTRALEKMR